MKANELRIGNFVYGDHENVEDVESIRHNGIGEGVDKYGDIDCQTQFHLLKPIPLTEEWLERFGFKGKKYIVNGNKTCIDDYRKGEGDWAIVLTKGINNPECFYFFKGMGKGLEVKYVHGLQNLYFALTGQELELKDK